VGNEPPLIGRFQTRSDLLADNVLIEISEVIFEVFQCLALCPVIWVIFKIP